MNHQSIVSTPISPQKKVTISIPVWLGLLLLYAAGVGCRILLSLNFSENPFIMPDESLYLNLARSIFSSGEILFRGQPITYDSLLYPILLSPLFSLPQSFNMYRVIQIFNALLMNAAVFPAFFLARRIIGKDGTAFKIAMVSLLLPDLAMTGIIMTESLGYPLTLVTFLFMYRAYKEGKIRDTILASVFAFLLYAVKPGAIATGIGFCICLLVAWLSSPKPEKAKHCRQFVISLLVLVGLVLLWRGVTDWAFQVDFGYTSVYEAQMHSFSLDTILRGLNGLPLYLFFFPIAMLVFPLLIPVAHGKALQKADRSLLFTAVISMLVTIIGICYVIYFEEYTGQPFAARIHLRYLFGFVPIFFMLSLSPSLENKQSNGCFFALLSFIIAALLTFTLNAFVSGEHFPIDALLMASINTLTPYTNLKTLAQLLLLVLTIFGGYWVIRHGWTKGMRNTILCLFIALCLGNNAAGYQQLHYNMDPAYTADAKQANELLPPSSYVAVANDGAYLWNPTTALDMHSPAPFFALELDDLLENTLLGGAYTPFVPRKYWREQNVLATPFPQWLVLDTEITYRVLLNNTANLLTTHNQKYTAVPVANGESWVHSGLSGLKNGWVSTNSKLSVFDEALCAQDTIKVWLQVSSNGSAELLTMEAPAFNQTTLVSQDTQWIEVDVPTPLDGTPFRLALTTTGDIYVETYLVQ